MVLDYSALKNAIKRLEEGIVLLQNEPSQDLFKDGVIQRFEFVYELCAKLLRRYFDSVSELSQASSREVFSDLIREASDNGLLLHGWDVWIEYRNARNRTSHTYDQEKANQVLGIVPAFLDDAKFLLTQLELRNKRADG